MKLSKEERSFVADGVEQGVRADGRDRLSTRPLQLQIGVLPQASGSAMLKCGGTRVIVGVKAELLTVDPRFPKCGKVEALVSCSTAASFEGRTGEDLATELSFAMNKLLSDGMPNSVYESLCVAPGQQCWNLYADATVLEVDGSVLDCVSMAIFAALSNTGIPQIKISEGNEIELLDGPEDCTLMDVTHVPVYVTLVQIGKRYVLDSTAVEEMCSDTRLSVGINAAGQFCASQKSEGRGLHPHQLGQMLLASQRLGQSRIEKLKALISSKSKMDEDEMLLDSRIF